MNVLSDDLTHLAAQLPRDELTQAAWARVRACLESSTTSTCPRCGEIASGGWCHSASGVIHCGCYDQSDEPTCPTCGALAQVDEAGFECDCATEAVVQVASLEATLHGDPTFIARFLHWWDHHGCYCRSGGGDYERTFAFEAACHFAVPQVPLAEGDRAQVLAHMAQLSEAVTQLRQTLGLPKALLDPEESPG